MFYVNLDPLVLEVLQEAKNMYTLGANVPDVIYNMAAKEPQLKEYRTKWVHQIIPYIKGIVQPKMQISLFLHHNRFEKLSIKSLAHQWMGALRIRVQTADKNIATSYPHDSSLYVI